MKCIAEEWVSGGGGSQGGAKVLRFGMLVVSSCPNIAGALDLTIGACGGKSPRQTVFLIGNFAL